MNIPPDRPVRLGILSLPAHLPIVRAATEKVCELIGFDEHSASAVVLSVDEALTNVIRHAYHGADDKSRAIAEYLWGYYWGLGDPTQIGLDLYGDGTKNYNFTLLNAPLEEIQAKRYDRLFRSIRDQTPRE